MRLQKFCSRTKAVVLVEIILLILVSSGNSGITPGDSNVVDEGDVTKAICDRITGLSKEQREICATYPDAMVAVGDGIHLAMNECQRQFHDHRWNCTIVSKRSTFGYIFLVGSREASFIYAITSAAITYTIASACSKGSINRCGCEINRRSKKHCKDCHSDKFSHPEVSNFGQNKNLWKWSGCSVNVDYAATFTRKFLDAREVEGDARSLMNLHNNKVGRKAVKENLKTDCKCHGMSGSCSLRTCWKTLPYFKVISNYLMDKYWEANGVTAIPMSQSRKLNTFRNSPQKTNNSSISFNIRLTKSVSKRFPKNTELVYLEPSPNYCEKDSLLGSLGTAGRTCNHSSTGMDGCDLMCCGRGYNIRQYTKQWQCRCKFYWCCYVTCDICTEKSEQHICK